MKETCDSHVHTTKQFALQEASRRVKPRGRQGRSKYRAHRCKTCNKWFILLQERKS